MILSGVGKSALNMTPRIDTSMSNSQNESPAVQVARLQRRVNALTSVMFILCCVTATALLVSANAQGRRSVEYDTVEAHEFRLLGPNGLAGRFGFYEAGADFQWPGLFLYNHKEKEVVRLYVRGDEPGAFSNPELEFSGGPSGRTGLLLYARKGEAAGLDVYGDGDLSPGARFYVSAGSGGLVARRPNGASARWP